jgi:hypothetical protein
MKQIFTIILIGFLGGFGIIASFGQAKKTPPPNAPKAPGIEVIKQIKETFGKYDYNQKVKFIHPDGLTGFELQTSKKTSFESDAFWKGVNDTLSYLYEFPKPIKDSVDQRNNGTISFYPPGGENILSAFDWSNVIQRSGDTLIVPFDSRPADNPYGKRFDWTHPGNFKNYARAWIFHNSMRPVSYRCNRKGTWSLKRNVLSFIAEPNQNEFNFELKYLKQNVVLSQLNGRQVTYIKEIPIESDTVFLELMDDQEEDGDMVSLYYDHEWIGKNLQVTTHPLRMFLPVAFGPEGSSFILHAENEGKVPPNTALVTIHTGSKKYSITLSSSKSQSAGIVLKRVKK